MINKKNRGAIVKLLLVITVLVTSCNTIPTDEYTVLTGPFRQSIIETGELEAVKASNIIMPQIRWEYGYRFKIIGLAEHGSMVKEGDSVIAMDPSSIYRYIIQREESLENEMATFKKQMVQRENNIQELQAQLRSEQASYELKKLELEKTKFESDLKQRLKELEYRQAAIKLEKVRKNLETRTRQEEIDLTIQEIKVEQRKQEIQQAMEALKNLTLYSPNEGVFQVAQNRWSRQNVRLGDEIYFGTKIASIPDLRKMKVLSQIVETDLSKIHTGMRVIIRLDALPTVPFHGYVNFISKIGIRQDEKNVFLTEVEIEESDIRLKPGMTVSCEYICFEEDQGTFIHNSCIYRKDGQSWIFPSKFSGEQKIEVECGPANSHHTLILTGSIEPGQGLFPVSKVDLTKLF